MKITVVDAPLIRDELTKMRDKNTGSIAFRKGLVHIGRYFSYEITKSFDWVEKEVKTPLAAADGIEIEDMKRVIVINVLRAAMPLVDGLLKVFPEARVGIISAFRGKAPEFKVSVDYVKVPRISKKDILIIADPMVATGSTMVRILKELRKYGEPKRKIITCVITTQYAMEKIEKESPDAEVYTAVIDPEINERGYIVPGLGDAGDRAFRNE
ncbi:MAG TPA: uracil phosphoribosyltransferase [Thermoplasmata archaeon]|nr:uracil phosphoribosyltransferase [Thermoplasmata archaeon]